MLLSLIVKNGFVVVDNVLNDDAIGIGSILVYSLDRDDNLISTASIVKAHSVV